MARRWRRRAFGSSIATSLEVSIDSVRMIILEIPESQWAGGGQTLAERRASEKSVI